LTYAVCTLLLAWPALGSGFLVNPSSDQYIGGFPVRARGMARLRILLSDGRGPLYRTGRGTLGAALRGVLAAL